MKSLIATLACTALLLNQGFAGTGPEKDRKAKQEISLKHDLLSPESALLFEQGRLSETVVQPIYSAADQLLYTEMLRILTSTAK